MTMSQIDAMAKQLDAAYHEISELKGVIQALLQAHSAIVVCHKDAMQHRDYANAIKQLQTISQS
jgi:hypothetical protein